MMVVLRDMLHGFFFGFWISGVDCFVFSWFDHLSVQKIDVLEDFLTRGTGYDGRFKMSFFEGAELVV